MSKTPKFEKRHFEYLAEILLTINLVNKYADSSKLTTDFVKNINEICSGRCVLCSMVLLVLLLLLVRCSLLGCWRVSRAQSSES